MDESIPAWELEELRLEDRDMRRFRRAAQTMMEIADKYRYGDGTAIGMATYELELASEKLGIVEPPKPKRIRRNNQIPRGVQRKVWDRDGWTCVACGGHTNLSVDHIIPLARGGAENDINNMQTMCLPCNVRKGARMP